MTPTLFLPGTLCDERLWMPTWRHLECIDRRYVPLQWANTLDEMLGMTEHSCEQQACRLIGFSMGGYVAATFALAFPQWVSELILVSYDPSGLTAQENQQRQQYCQQLKKGRFKPMSASRLAQFVDPQQPRALAIGQTIRDMEADLGASVLLAHTQSTTPRVNLCQRLAEAPFKTRLYVGTKDTFIDLSRIPSIAQESQAELHLLEEAGHMLPLEKPQGLAALLSQS